MGVAFRHLNFDKKESINCLTAASVSSETNKIYKIALILFVINKPYVLLSLSNNNFTFPVAGKKPEAELS